MRRPNAHHRIAFVVTYVRVASNLGRFFNVPREDSRRGVLPTQYRLYVQTQSVACVCVQAIHS